MKGMIHAEPTPALWPMERPAIDWNFALRRALDPRVTFTRASSGTYVDSVGLIQTAAVNVPRFDHDTATGVSRGLLIEESRTNKCTNANANPAALTNVVKTGDAAAVLSLVDDSAAISAAGLGGVCVAGNAFKLDNSAGATTAFATIGGACGNVNTHTLSIYARTTAGVAQLKFTGAGITGPDFAGVGYARRSFSGVPSAPTDGLVVRAPAGAVVYFVLNQMEEGASASSPIVVSGAAATRAADVISCSGANFSSWYRQDEGTFLYELAGVVPAFGYMIGVTSGSVAEFAGLRANSVSRYLGYVRAANTDQASLVSVVGIDATRAKLALGIKANDFALSANGAAVLTDSAGIMPAAISWGGGPNAASPTGQVTLARLRYWRRRLPNAVLQRLSA